MSCISMRFFRGYKPIASSTYGLNCVLPLLPTKFLCLSPNSQYL